MTRYITGLARDAVRVLTIPPRVAWSGTKTLGRWSWRQVTGFGRGVRSLIGDRGDVLPEPVKDTWSRIKRAVPEAFGWSGSPSNQVTSSILLAAVAFGSSVITMGATAFLVALFALTGLVGILRLIPAVNRQFTRVRGGAKSGAESGKRTVTRKRRRR